MLLSLLLLLLLTPEGAGFVLHVCIIAPLLLFGGCTQPCCCYYRDCKAGSCVTSCFKLLTLLTMLLLFCAVLHC